MRKLKTSETRLVLLFAAALFVALNLFLVRLWLDASARVRTALSASEARLAEQQGWIDAAGGLGAAGEWMAANPPPESGAEAASAALLAEIRKASESAGLKTLEENLLPAPGVATGQAVAVQMKVAGPFADAAKLLFEVQGPAKWRTIPRLVLRSDTEPPNVVMDIEIRQYYRPAAVPEASPGP